MKRTLSLFMFCALFAGNLYAQRSTKDIVTFQMKGSTEIALGVSSQGAVYNTEGLFVARESWIDVPAHTTFSVLSVNFATGAIITISSTVWNSGTTNQFAFAASTKAVNPPYPVRLVLSWTANRALADGVWVGDSRGITSSTNVIQTTITISGFDAKGSSRTERIAVSTTAVITAHAFNEIVYVAVSSVSQGLNQLGSTITIVNENLSIGTTGQYGLANNLSFSFSTHTFRQTTSDIIRVIEQNIFITSYTVTAGPDVIRFTTPADGSVDYHIWYRAKESPPQRVNPKR